MLQPISNLASCTTLEMAIQADSGWVRGYPAFEHGRRIARLFGEQYRRLTPVLYGVGGSGRLHRLAEQQLLMQSGP